MIKHIRWSLREGDITTNGLVAFKWNRGIERGNRLIIQRLEGKALPAQLLVIALDEAFGKIFFEEAEKLHKERYEPYKVRVHTGMSGAMDIEVVILENKRMAYAPIVDNLHVSMYGKINYEITELWVGNVPIILAELVKHYPPPGEDQRFYVEAENPSWVFHTEFNEPGQESGFLSILEKIREEYKGAYPRNR